MKLNINPAPAFREAPSAIRALYLALIGMSVSWLAAQIAAVMFGMNLWFLLLDVVLVYLVVDTGLVVLKGRGIGRNLSRFWSLLVIASFVFALVGPTGQPLAVLAGLGAAGIFAALVLVLSFVPAVKAHFAARAGEKLVDIKAAARAKAERKQADPEVPRSGSFESLVADGDDLLD